MQNSLTRRTKRMSRTREDMNDNFYKYERQLLIDITDRIYIKIYLINHDYIESCIKYYR